MPQPALQSAQSPVGLATLGAPRPAAAIAGLLVCFAVPFVGFAVVEALHLDGYGWRYEPLHAAIEGIGGGVALVLARLLLLEMKHDGHARHLMVVATALVVMGTLDVVHALAPAGNAFHWTRSLSTLFGGALFCAVWLPPAWAHARWLHLPLSAAVVAGCGGVVMLVYSAHLPPMLDAHAGYSATARALNVTGGAGFFAAAVWFACRFFRERTVDSLAFASQCVLFGAAGVLMALADVWHPIWWAFHGLRLIAYLAVLRYTFKLFGASQRAMAEANEILEERVRVRTAELQEEKAAREQFVMMLTHDLRNPLNAAMMNAHMLLKSGADSPRVAAGARRLASSVERAARMIDDLLDANRIQAGQRVPLEIVRCDLNEICREVVDELAGVHGAGRFVVECSGETVGWWSCDGLQRVIENLVGNAVKYGDGGRPITIRVDAGPRTTRLAVHNHGDALSPEERARIFAPFVRGDAARTSGQHGWGIGLTLVRGLVEAHGGSVSVDSAPGRGTTFTVELPTDARPSSRADPRAASAPVA